MHIIDKVFHKYQKTRKERGAIDFKALALDKSERDFQPSFKYERGTR